MDVQVTFTVMVEKKLTICVPDDATPEYITAASEGAAQSQAPPGSLLDLGWQAPGGRFGGRLYA
jgi:hypothetical protein